MPKIKSSGLTLCFALLINVVTPQVANAYADLTVLGIGMATDINDQGQIAGYSGTYLSPTATLWIGSTSTSLSTPLGAWSIASSINNLGQIAGTIGSGTGASGVTQAVKWNVGGVVNVLESVGGQYSAHDINDSGQIVGDSFYPTSSAQQAILWNGTTPTTFGVQSVASAINNAGQIAGFKNGQATLWNDYIPTLLDNPNGAYSSQTYGLNNSVQIVGYSFYYNTGFQATVWNSVTPTKLGTLGGDYSGAFDINDSGLIVGFSNTADGKSHATMWTLDREIVTATDLNSLIDPALEFTLTSAQAINRSGQIVGYGINNSGQTEAFVLSMPTVPLPAGWLLMLSGLSLAQCISKGAKRSK